MGANSPHIIRSPSWTLKRLPRPLISFLRYHTSFIPSSLPPPSPKRLRRRQASRRAICAPVLRMELPVLRLPSTTTSPHHLHSSLLLSPSLDRHRYCHQHPHYCHPISFTFSSREYSHSYQQENPQVTKLIVISFTPSSNSASVQAN